MAESNQNNTKSAPKHANKEAAEVKPNPIHQLSQIKDIIFGPEMEEMTDSISSLRADLNQQKLDLEKRISTLNAELVDSLVKLNDSLSDNMEKVIKDMNGEISALKNARNGDRKELGQMLIQLGQQLMKDE